jgi:hypothetical protein
MTTSSPSQPWATTWALTARLRAFCVVRAVMKYSAWPSHPADATVLALPAPPAASVMEAIHAGLVCRRLWQQSAHDHGLVS